MSNVTQISLESLLLRATSLHSVDGDIAALNAFFALINKERDGPVLGARVIASRLPAGSEKEVLSTLNILDMGMSKCGTAFQNEVGKFRFLNEMIKLVSPKYLGSKTPLAVKQKILQLLYLWTLDYPKELKIKEAFDMLRKQGVIKEIPNPNIPQEALGINSDIKKRVTSNSIFQDEEKSNILKKLLQSKDPEDIQAANWLIKSMVKEDEKLADKKSKTLMKLDSVQNNIKLLIEMIECFKEGDTTKNELDLMKELHDNLLRFKENLKSMACMEENWPVGLLETVLKTMDEVTECSNKYTYIVLNGKFEKTTTKSHLASLLELDQQQVTPSGSTSLIQIDHLKSTVDDQSSLSSNYGSSNHTSNSISMDVLCDVFPGLSGEDVNILQPISVVTGNGIHKNNDDKNSKALEDLDVLSEHLLKENLPVSNRNEKIPMNLLTKINEVKLSQQQQEKIDYNCLLHPDDNSATSKKDDVLAQGDLDDCLVDITDEKNGKCENTNRENEVVHPVKLKDISIKLEDIKPSSTNPIRALEEKNGLSVLLHKAAQTPKPSVSVYVVTTISKNEMPLTNYLFQAVVPKGCKLRLLPPSSTELPSFNAFLPPSAITQIMLIGNEVNKDKIDLKFIVSYVMDEDTVTEMGEVPDLPLDFIAD
ncbi:hypothetical protein ABEB36_011637 [Hypothenemus hampei]|uniref:ADP-ribosylation factor-binding protein GGA1 n=1 Tax=Hypothenemus hampei TaxID=57062 RepID=A0ABD1E8R6_HYPHA